MGYYTRVFENFANFNGRDSRKQYWMFVLINIIIEAVLETVCLMLLGKDAASGVIGLYSLVLLIPNLAIAIRRMHDIGKSGWWILVSFIPLIGWIWALILFCSPSEVGTNRYGEQPID